jgi:hypothetical protein
MKNTFIVTAKSGADAVYQYLMTATDTLQVDIKPYDTKRSNAQNALLHVWMGDVSEQYYLSHGSLYSPIAWKEYFKKMFLGEETLEVPRGTIVRTRRSRDLKVKEMTKFMEQIQFYCATELEIILMGLEER